MFSQISKFENIKRKEAHEYAKNLKWDISIEIKKYYKKRTNPQNRYYWGVIIEIMSKHFWYTPEELHQHLTYLFLVNHHDETVKSTSILTTVEFNEYIEKIIVMASSEFGIILPDPCDYDVDIKIKK